MVAERGGARCLDTQRGWKTVMKAWGLPSSSINPVVIQVGLGTRGGEGVIH